MKKLFFSLVALPLAFAAQGTQGSDQYPNTFTSRSADVQAFDNEAKKYNDWAISLGGGFSFIPHGDLTSFSNDEFKSGWNGYVSLDKQITHEFGLNLMYSKGKTNQVGQLPMPYGAKAGLANAWTKYDKISLLGDANLTQLFGRTRPFRDYKVAFHGYAGIGLMGYETELVDKDLSPASRPVKVDQELGIASFIFDLGAGVKFKASKSVDFEIRTMYTFTGDEEFDGGGDERKPSGAGSERISYNLINDTFADNLWTVTAGLSVKLGKHEEHLQWVDPLKDIYGRMDTLLLEENTKLKTCVKGDMDNDAICDDWDKELDTPAGARVDGSGKAFDMDLDGTIDLYDKCPTVAGPTSNQGCPQ